MSNFFEQELWHLFGDGKVIGSPTCLVQACFGTLGKDLRVRVEFTYVSNYKIYSALKLTVLNRTNGPVDIQLLHLIDLLGIKPISNRSKQTDGVAPHIWDDSGRIHWFIYHPTEDDYETIRQAVKQYLDVFRDRQQKRTQDSPKRVYVRPPRRRAARKGKGAR